IAAEKRRLQGFGFRVARPERLEFVRRGRVEGRLIGVVEKRVELEVLALRDRIVLVGVALSAPESEAEKRQAGRIDAVNDGLVPDLLLVRAALVIDHRVAMEPRRDELLPPGSRQQVARELLDREAVER